MPDPKQRVPEDFHALYDQATRAARGVRAAARSARPEFGRMAAEVPNLAMQLDEATNNPVQISVGALGRTAGRLSARDAESPESSVRQFVQDRADLWQLDAGDVATVDVVGVSRNGMPTVRMVQRVGGVEVFQSDMTAAVTPQNDVVSVAGQLFRGAAGAPERAAARAAAAVSALAAEDAIARAASDLTGSSYSASEFRSIAERSGADSGSYRFYESRRAARPADGPTGGGTAAQAGEPPRFQRPVRVKDVLFPLGEGEFVPGYYLELWLEGYPAFSYVVDKVDAPDILFRKNLTSGLAFKYRVHNVGGALCRPEDGPAPGTPHPTGAPDGFQAAPIAEKLIEIESLLPGRPWLPDNATTTRGNNCTAYADLRAPSGFGPGDVEGTVTAPGVFDTAYDHSKPASDPGNLQNSLVGMFFHVNWLHDRWYEAGFDEASGNAQQNNFGLGGLDGDPILAEGNDFSGTDNANMSTPSDGSSPRMQMFRFDGPNPQPSRTSNHEALITFHEMGHYITNRLVANASGLTNVQGRAMGEGWGDFFAVCMTSQETDDFAAGVFAAGGWTDVTPTFAQNYYFSIRRYPYCADMAKSPLTFKHISANVVLPAGPPKNPNAGGPNEEFHNAGEIWCCALWEVFVNLVTKHGHAEGERRVLRYVIGGLKLTPARPTFLQARDAILAAAGALDPDDVQVIWQGFAKRGMGVDAVGPPSSSSNLTGVVESFSVPAAPVAAVAA